MSTQFQPTLPPEIAPTDAELDFIELSPGGLFPENQDSNFGLLRKIWCDKITDLATQQALMYNEKFPDTSTQFLDDHERQYGLPIASTSLTIAQRRQNVLNRIRVGPFTRARRIAILENFITATFGTPIMLTPDGVAMDAAGVPLFSEGGTVTSLYSVRENQPNVKNLVPNPDFETNTTGWGTTNTTLTRDNAHSKFGLWAAKLVAVAAGQQYINYPTVATLSGATAGLHYTASAWIYATGGMIGKQGFIQLNETGGAGATASMGTTNATLVAGWNHLVISGTVVNNDRTGLEVRVGEPTTGAAIGDTIWVDGVQIEAGTSATSFVSQGTTPFYYEVRISNTITPDDAGLHRELDRITPAHISYVIEYVPFDSV